MVHFCFNLPFSSQKNSSTLLHTFRMLKSSTRHTTNTNPVPPTVEPWEVGCCSLDSGGFEKMRIENWRRLWINSRIMWRTPSSNPMLKPWCLVLAPCTLLKRTHASMVNTLYATETENIWRCCWFLGKGTDMCQVKNTSVCLLKLLHFVPGQTPTGDCIWFVYFKPIIYCSKYLTAHNLQYEL